MNLFKYNDMIGGWFVGDFSPTAFRTKDCEVSFKIHYKGEQWGAHYHTKVTEINLITEGKMILQDKELKGGDIFVLAPYEIADPVFLTDCSIVCVKLPSSGDDKVTFSVTKKGESA